MKKGIFLFNKYYRPVLLTPRKRKILGNKLADKIRSNKKVESNMCQICCLNETNGLFMYCGHGNICINCAFEIASQKPECPLCRAEIKQVVQQKYPNNYKDIYQAICITNIVIEQVDEDGNVINNDSITNNSDAKSENDQDNNQTDNNQNIE